MQNKSLHVTPVSQGEENSPESLLLHDVPDCNATKLPVEVSLGFKIAHFKL